MSNIIHAEWDIMLNGKKYQLEIILNIINAEWDIITNGKTILKIFQFSNI
jgi:hypothetical protein